MEIYKDFEDWILSHNTKELLFINQDANIRNKVAKDVFKYIQEAEKQSLIDKYNEFIIRTSALKAEFKTDRLKEIVGSLVGQAQEELEKIKLITVMTEDEKGQFEYTLRNLKVYYSQCESANQ